MSEIWNLSTLCRCCHSDGCFKKLNQPYHSENCIEIYEIMLQQALGIKIILPSMDQASYAICDNCIKRLRDASQFREQVLSCEHKFNIYFTNEQFLNSVVQSVDVKTEIESIETESDDMIIDEDVHSDNDFLPPDDCDRISVSVKDGCVQPSNCEQNAVLIKEEIAIEVGLKLPVEVKDEKEIIKENIENEDKMSTDKKSIQKTKLKERLTPAGFYDTRTKCGRHVFKTYIARKKSNNGLSLSCKICACTYRSKCAMYKHIQREHYSRCACDQCGQTFKYISHLQKHMKTHEKPLIKCRHCDVKFAKRKSLNAHEKTHKPQQTFQCDICQKELRYKTTLRKHILLHTGDSNVVLCDVCGWSFNQRCNLEAHIRSVHLKMRPYACTICGKTYTAKKHVKGHMKSAHSGNPKPHQCDQCTRCFACPKSFKLHKLTHENHFGCRNCQQVFDNKKDLEIHIKSHKNSHLLNSPYSCHVCGKGLMSKYTLNRHLEVHSGIKRYSCDLCGLKFTQKTMLKRHHMRKHDPNIKMEKVKCDICKKMVRYIDKHMDIHNADKRKFFCDLCGKSYSTNNALTRHKAQRHYGVSYDCDVCGKKYIQKGSLRTHKMKVHKIKKDMSETVASVQDMELTSVVTSANV